MLPTKILLITIFALAANSAIAAPCAICTIAIGSGLGISRMLGISDAATGIWAGAALFALSYWTIKWLENKKWTFKGYKIIVTILFFLMLLPLYLGDTPRIVFGLQTILYVDAFLLSVACGVLGLILPLKLYAYIKQKRGKPHFPFEKVVFPLVVLTLLSILFNFLV